MSRTQDTTIYYTIYYTVLTSGCQMNQSGSGCIFYQSKDNDPWDSLLEVFQQKKLYIESRNKRYIAHKNDDTIITIFHINNICSDISYSTKRSNRNIVVGEIPGSTGLFKKICHLAFSKEMPNKDGQNHVF